MSTSSESGPIRLRALLTILIGAATFVALVQWAAWFITNHPESPWRVPAAVAPMAAISICCAAAMSSFRGMDERASRMHLEALAFGFITSVLLLLPYTFLVFAGLVPLFLNLILPVMVFCWILGLAISTWRYR